MRTKITLFLSMIITLSLHTQNIEFTFANAQTTNDGANDFYEVDVMIAAIDGQADFKLGKGQVYINYSSAAFGTFIDGGGGLVITYPEVNGYILGLVNGFPYYSTPVQNDNSSSRFSFSYQQGISSGSMPANNVTSTPTKLFHIKMQFTDAGQLPMVALEDNETQVAGCRDQFETACGPSIAGFPDCTGFSGVVFNDANFDSGGAVLSTDRLAYFKDLLIYPNPAKETLNVNISASAKYLLTDLNGKTIINGKLLNRKNTIVTRGIESGIYFLKIKSANAEITKKIIIE